MRVVVEPTRCQGHGRCYSVSEHFQIDDFDGHGYTEGDVPIGLEASVRSAILACPEQAILIVENTPGDEG